MSPKTMAKLLMDKVFGTIVESWCRDSSPTTKGLQEPKPLVKVTYDQFRSMIPAMHVSKHHPSPVIAVVIPCYRARSHILSVLGKIGPEVSLIVVVDDACPEQTGKFVEQMVTDGRLTVTYLETNQGVGGAVLAGYRQAIALGATVLVKIDGDDQMDPSAIRQFVEPIINGCADYTKGNRFFDLESLKSMPLMRLVGNAGLSFITKLSSGYWKIMDPTNGYTAIDARIAAILPHDKIASRYFFESDMLFRLNTFQAVVEDIPMDAFYGNEKSNLRIKRVLLEFPVQHAIRFFKRIFYTYLLRDFNAASMQLIVGILLTASGTIFGLTRWIQYSSTGASAPTGTVLLATIQIIIGMQCLLAWITHDLNSNPQSPVSTRISPRTSRR